MNKPKVGSLFISPVCTSQIRLLPVSLVPIALPPSPNSRLIYPITWILWLDIENGYLKLTYPKDNFVSSPPNRGLSAFITISVMGSPPTLCINQKPMGPSKLCPWLLWGHLYLSSLALRHCDLVLGNCDIGGYEKYPQVSRWCLCFQPTGLLRCLGFLNPGNPQIRQAL